MENMLRKIDDSYDIVVDSRENFKVMTSKEQYCLYIRTNCVCYDVCSFYCAMLCKCGLVDFKL
uniref:Protein C8 n=1 Tax=Heterorhabditis bacteriophora TaxID=37862 RepID=A0A1I7X669_HETBA